MIVIDLTLATRSANLTGIERLGINLFEAWSARGGDVLALACPGARFVSSQVHIIDRQPMAAWMLAPYSLPKNTEAVLFPSFPPSPLFLGKTLPRYRIIHDTVPFEHGHTMPLRGRLVFRDLERIFLPKYAGVFCPTGIVAARFEQLFPKIPVSVCGNAPGLDIESGDIQPISGIEPGDRFVLAVGTLEPRKNYLRLVELFRDTSPPGLKLLIAGRAGWGGIDGQIRELAGQSEKIVWLPGVADAELRWLYRQCAAFVSFSTAEGFNMPLVEAGCFARPILASDIEIHRAVAAPWARFIELDATPQSFAQALADAIQKSVAPERAAQYRGHYSWPGISRTIQAAMSSPELASRELGM